MKKHLTIALLLFFYSAATYSGIYGGVKGGVMKIDNDINFDDTNSIGLLFGGTFQDGGLAVEGELTTTVSAADHKTRDGAKLDIYTLAIYGVYRSSGKFYFKGKAGLLSEYLNISGFNFPLEGSAVGLSLGAGAGLKISNSANLELEYTIIETDIDFISLGVNFAF